MSRALRHQIAAFLIQMHLRRAARNPVQRNLQENEEASHDAFTGGIFPSVLKLQLGPKLNLPRRRRSRRHYSSSRRNTRGGRLIHYFIQRRGVCVIQYV